GRRGESPSERWLHVLHAQRRNRARSRDRLGHGGGRHRRHGRGAGRLSLPAARGRRRPERHGRVQVRPRGPSRRAAAGHPGQPPRTYGGGRLPAGFATAYRDTMRSLALVGLVLATLASPAAALTFHAVEPFSEKGAFNLIIVPEPWNGSFIVYAHGYTADQR